jgi:predicted O-methyltransferase YrrM
MTDEVHVRPLEDLNLGEFEPHVDLCQSLDALFDSEDFQRADEYFRDYPKDSLLFGCSRAFLYQLLRLTKPETVVEIGTYQAGTTEVLARALWANGRGELFTVDPYGEDRAPRKIAQWPQELQDRTTFRPLTSMDFFIEASAKNLRFDVVFVDGNHDYEFAYYDLNMAVKRLTPGGVVIMDNGDQPGPFWAAKTFLAQNPGWREMSGVFEAHEERNPFRTMRTSVPTTLFIVLVAPRHWTVTGMPVSFECDVDTSEVGISGIHLSPLEDCGAGMLHTQLYFRSFRDGEFPEELHTVERHMIAAGSRPGALNLPAPLLTEWPDSVDRRLCEINLIWQPIDGDGPLCLSEPPRPVALDQT